MDGGQAMLPFVPGPVFSTFLFILILLRKPIFQKNLVDAVMWDVIPVLELDYFLQPSRAQFSVVTYLTVDNK